jgi:23S rRNA pseudouridine2605 synthase
MRLNKFLAQAGVSSRRGADLLIQSGRVTVNGAKIQRLGISVDEKKDEIKVNGKKVCLPEKFIYILLNKPKGYLCTVKDRFGRPTVLDLVGKDKKVFPVGRLDLDTEGVLLLTNDGKLAYRLTHPKFQVEKTYLVTLKGKIDEKIFKKFHKGIKLEDGTIAKGEAKLFKIEKRFDFALRQAQGGERSRTTHRPVFDSALRLPPKAGCRRKVAQTRGEPVEGGTSVLELKLREGRKREIKRMCKTIGFPVTNLVRTKFATLIARNLKPGAWRYLKEREIGDLKRTVGL